MGEGVTNPVSYTYSSDAITLNNPSKTGYSFAGWTGTELNEATTTVTIAANSTGDRSYTATWTPISYNITYNLNEGSLPSGVTNPATYTIETPTFTLVNPSKAGSEFAGWTVGDAETPETTVTIEQGTTGNKTLTANWTVGNLIGSVTLDKTSPVYGDIITATAVPTNLASEASLEYAWKADGTLISGATSETYTVGLDDIGKNIAVEVTSSDEGQLGTIISDPTAKVARKELTLEGTAAVASREYIKGDRNAIVTGINIASGGILEADTGKVALPATITGKYDTEYVGSNKTVTIDEIVLTGDSAAGYVISNAGSYATVTGVTITAITQTLTASDSLVVKKEGTLSKEVLAGAISGAVGELSFTVKEDSVGTIDGSSGAYTAPGTVPEGGKTTLVATAAVKDVNGDGTDEYSQSTVDLNITINELDSQTVTFEDGITDNKVEVNYVNRNDEGFKALYTATATAGSDAGGEITYSSSNTDVAAINGTTIAIEGIGSTVITATAAAVDGYNPGTASYTLVVKNKAIDSIDNTIAVATISGTPYTGNPIEAVKTATGYSIVSGTGTATNAGSYTATVQPDTGYVWATNSAIAGTTITESNNMNPFTISWSITKASAGSAPDVVAVQPTNPDGNNGQIVKNGDGEITGLEYQKGNGAWVSAATTPITGLSAGTYNVRFAETDNAEASTSTTIEIKTTHKVTFVTGKGTITSTNPLSILNGEKASAPTLDGVPAGYGAPVWKNGDTAWTFGENTVTSDVVLTATWTPLSYTISYDSDSLEGTNYAQSVTSYTVESESFAISNPTKSGQTFLGWTVVNATDSSKNITTPTKTLRIEKGSYGNLTLTANWETTTYDLIYELNGGTLPSGVTNPDKYSSETTSLALTNPTRSGFEFKGWTCSDTSILGGLTLNVSALNLSEKTGALTFYANWQERAATPVATPAAGAVVSGTTVTLSTSTEGATIYYTTNGDVPTSGSDQYNEPITITEATTIKAIAVKSGMADSDVLSAAYTIQSSGGGGGDTPTPTNVDITGITVTPTTAKVEVGKTVALSSAFTPSNATETATVTWSSSDTTVATVDTTGTVTGVKAGTAAITASVTAKGGTFTATCEVTVEEKLVEVTGININSATATVEEKSTTQLTAVFTPEDQTENPEVTWTSSDSSIATVDATGLVTGVKQGKATITAKITGTKGEFSATSEVTVTEKIVPVSSVTLNNTIISVKKGSTAALTATVLPEDATDKAVTWTSGDSSIATVADGTVTGVKAGTTTITATAGDKSATAVVTVTEEEPDEEDEQTDLTDLIEDTGDGRNLADVIKEVVVNTEEGTQTKIWIGGIESSYPYTGSAIKPAIHVYDGIKQLAVADYSVSYKNNKNAGDSAEITVKFKGNYKGTADQTVKFSIAKADLSDIKIPDVAVKQGSAPKFTLVTESGLNVPAKAYGVAYDVTDIKKAEAGEYTATFTAKDTTNYEGTATATVTVIGKKDKNRDLANGKIKLEYTSAVWTGEAMEPAVTVTDSQKATVDPSKYEVSYLNNTAVGKATVIVTANDSGEDGYVGSKTATFTIKKGKTGGVDCAIAESVEFSAAGARAAVTVTDTDTGATLKEGTDYTVKYSGNKEVTSSAEAKITGKGIYKFSKTLTYAITAKDISKVSFSAADVVGANKCNKAKLTVTDGGKSVPKKYYKAPVFTIGGEAATKAAEGDEVTVTIEGDGKTYTGSVSATYRVIAKANDISKAGVGRIADKVYTGSKVTLKDSDLTGLLTLNNKTLVPGEDFEVAGYTKNDKKGTAKVTLRGIENGDTVYGGTKTVSFKIVEKKGVWKESGKTLVDGEWKN